MFCNYCLQLLDFSQGVIPHAPQQIPLGGDTKGITNNEPSHAAKAPSLLTKIYEDQKRINSDKPVWWKTPVHRQGFPALLTHAPEATCDLCTMIYSNVSVSVLEVLRRSSQKDIDMFFVYRLSRKVDWLTWEPFYKSSLLSIWIEAGNCLIPMFQFGLAVESGIRRLGSKRGVEILNTGSINTSILAASWLENCLKHHLNCEYKKGEHHNPPTRLIDVGDASGTQKPHLCSPGPVEAPYMTLSHRWGKKKRVMLTNASLNAMKESIDISSLPETYQDAFTITRSLGLRYLWIDSLCIIQDSLDDWRTESGNMGEIYKSSFCTIAASWSSDDAEGCFLDRPPLYAKIERTHHVEARMKICNGTSLEKAHTGNLDGRAKSRTSVVRKLRREIDITTKRISKMSRGKSSNESGSLSLHYDGLGEFGRIYSQRRRDHMTAVSSSMNDDMEYATISSWTDCGISKQSLKMTCGSLGSEEPPIVVPPLNPRHYYRLQKMRPRSSSSIQHQHEPKTQRLEIPRLAATQLLDQFASGQGRDDSDRILQTSNSSDILDNGVTIYHEHDQGDTVSDVPRFEHFHDGPESWKRAALYIRPVQKDLWMHCVDSSPLNSRAWVLQERLLSPRILHYTKTQLFWECKTTKACESNPMPVLNVKRAVFAEPVYLDKSHELFSLITEPLHEHWPEIIERYSATSGTKLEDKLIAISGLAKQVQSVTKDRYCAGIWRKDLLTQLLWRLQTPQYESHPVYQAPSWSWASTEGKVEFIREEVCYDIYKLEVVSVQSIGVDGKPWAFGQIEYGSLHVRGALRSAHKCEHRGEKFRLVLTDQLEEDLARSHCDYFPDSISKSLPNSPVCLPVVHCLSGLNGPGYENKLHGFVAGLVLEPTGEYADEYRRLGAFHLPTNTAVTWFGLDQRLALWDITIV